MDRFTKQFISLRYYLIGKGYHQALKALNFAKKHHKGFRKNKVDPELLHQVEICLYITTLKNIVNEELTLTVALLHDVAEDYNISFSELDANFGKVVAESVGLLTKKFQGIHKDPKQYFEDISNCPISCVVKGSDRIHNVQTMIGVFSKEKQLSYLAEVESNFLPMIKKAKYNFPELTHALFNIEHMLKSQLQLIKAMHC